ncbi:MAG: GHKL domain-containing protein [Bacteroidetes bacterium]|nr:GHKL domain-containing protein [Bacteroidota bacterium]
MNNLNVILRKYRLAALYLLLGAALFTGGKWIENYLVREGNDTSLIKRFEKIFNKKEKFLDETLDQVIKYENADSQMFSQEEIDKLSKKNIAVLVYHDDSLVFWSDNSFKIPEKSDKIEQSVVFLQNGWYFKKSKHTGNKTVIGLILLKSQFNYENQFLKNEFPNEYHLPSCYMISKNGSVGGVAIHALNDIIPFYLTKDKDIVCYGNAVYYISMVYLFALLAILLCLRKVQQNLISKKAKTWGLFLLFLLLIMGYLFFIKVKFSIFYFSLDLFSPYYCSLSEYIPSLGEFFLLSLFTFFFSYNFFKDFKLSLKSDNTTFIARLITGWGWLLITSAVFAIIFSIFRSLIINSIIPLDFSKIQHFTFNSFIGLISICLLIISVILLIQKVIYSIKDILNSYWQIAGLFVSLIVFLIAGFITGTGVIIMPAVFFLVIGFTGILGLRFGFTPFNYLVILVFIMGVFSTLLLINTTHNKEMENRKVVAVSLGAERDPVAELFFKELDTEIQNDQQIVEILKKWAFFDRDEDDIYDILKNKYFKGFWEKYDLFIVICHENSGLIVNDQEKDNCFSFFNELLESEGNPLGETGFTYLGSTAGRIRYFGVFYFSCEQDNTENGLFIELNSKIRYTQQGYPELLLDEELIRDMEIKNYSSAKYYKGKLISQSGEFPYSLAFPDSTNEQEFEFAYFDGYEHLIYRIDSQNIIIVGKPRITIVDYLITFSYLFVLLIVLLYFIRVLIQLPGITGSRQFDFKSKIQWSLLLILIISLLSIGGGAIYLSIQQYKDEHFNNLSEKMQSVYVELEHKLSFENSLVSGWSSDQYPTLNDLLRKFSNVFYSDINLYDSGGNLLATSRPEIFNKGLIGEKMNIEAYNWLKVGEMAEFVHNETIGDLRYMSGYIPFTNYENKLLAYLNLPYFSREDVLAGEISKLVVGIVNFSVVLILLIMGLAVFISARITNPLRMIQKEFSKIELGKEIKSIHYEGDDEIGSLVSEYNRMVKELARSVEMLAKSERESAWREMAKQIAHEIKNPLTPMKLSVQQLQKAWDDKAPKWNEYLNTFSNNLIEQIEHLSSIASEFSNFAEIPKSKGEVVNVITKIKKSVELFSNEGNIDFKLDLNDKKKVFIYFDKEKMVQVFSNLINNAIQSIPDDRRGRITISLDIIDKNVLIKIADNGSGIPKKIGDKLFEPNFTTKTSGMGLGLAIVKNIMEDAGGRIWYETEIGKGSAFIIEMPLHLPG